MVGPEYPGEGATNTMIAGSILFQMKSAASNPTTVKRPVNFKASR